MKERTYGTVNLRLEDIQRLKRIAAKERRSMAQQMSHLIDEYCKLQETA